MRNTIPRLVAVAIALALVFGTVSAVKAQTSGTTTITATTSGLLTLVLTGAETFPAGLYYSTGGATGSSATTAASCAADTTGKTYFSNGSLKLQVVSSYNYTVSATHTTTYPTGQDPASPRLGMTHADDQTSTNCARNGFDPSASGFATKFLTPANTAIPSFLTGPATTGPGIAKFVDFSLRVNTGDAFGTFSSSVTFTLAANP